MFSCLSFLVELFIFACSGYSLSVCLLPLRGGTMKTWGNRRSGKYDSKQERMNEISATIFKQQTNTSPRILVFLLLHVFWLIDVPQGRQANIKTRKTKRALGIHCRLSQKTSNSYRFCSRKCFWCPCFSGRGWRNTVSCKLSIFRNVFWCWDNRWWRQFIFGTQ